MIQEVFKMLNQFAVEIPTLLSRSVGMPSRREGPPSVWDTHGISGNVFANPDVSSSAPSPQELNPWSSRKEEPLHSSTAEKTERQTQDQDQRCQSGPSAKDSVILSGGDSSKNYGADQQRLQISDLHFWQIPYTRHVCLLEDKIQDWGMYLFSISYGSDAVGQRSGDGCFSGWFDVFVINKRNSNAEFWSTRCEDCFSTEQNLPTSHFKRRLSLEEHKAQRQDRFLRGRQIAYLIYEYFRVTGATDSVENNSDLFTIALRNDDIQEFDS